MFTVDNWKVKWKLICSACSLRFLLLNNYSYTVRSGIVGIHEMASTKLIVFEGRVYLINTHNIPSTEFITYYCRPSPQGEKIRNWWYCSHSTDGYIFLFYSVNHWHMHIWLNVPLIRYNHCNCENRYFFRLRHFSETLIQYDISHYPDILIQGKISGWDRLQNLLSEVVARVIIILITIFVHRTTGVDNWGYRGVRYLTRHLDNILIRHLNTSTRVG